MESGIGTGTIGRRYHIEGLLGRGGMGTVYRAWDHLTGQHIALKRVTQPTTEAAFSTSYNAGDFRLALAREFKFLASLRHPNIIQVLDYGFDQQQPYYTMELLHDASTILNFGRQASFKQQLHLIVQMLQALSYLHRRGILHRDLKPANVMITAGNLKLLDFGLSIMRDRVEVDEPDNTTAGTLAYMAPEILIGHPASPASDLYSFGILSIELLAGKHPFTSEDIGALVNQILYTIPDIELTGINTEIGFILSRLVQKDPADRYATAQDVIAALELASDEPIERETLATRESFLQAAQLVGRDKELAQLTGAIDKLQESKGSAWVLTGESGVGKSRMLDELRTLAMVRGALVIRGQTINEGGAPFYVWQDVLRWLVLTLDLTAEERTLLRTLIRQPISHDEPAQTQMPPTSFTPQQIQTHLLTLLRRMIETVEQPIVLIFEDLQWAGSESIALLEQVCTIVDDAPVLIATSYRDNEGAKLTDQLAQTNWMPMSRLDPEGIAQLSAAMIGEAGKQPHVLGLLQRETEGNVLFLIEVVRALAEEAGTLDQIGKITLPESVFSGGIQKIIQRRMESIPEWTLPVLQAASVYGRKLDIPMLRVLFPKVDIEQWLLICSEANVIEVQDGTWHFSHDRMRDTLLAQLPHDERQSSHYHIASAIETMYKVQDYATLLAYHWGMAGAKKKEQQYLTLAGEQALRSGAYHEAIQFFNRGLSLLSEIPSSPQTQQQGIILHQKQGEAHLGIGAYEQAQAIFEACLATARHAQQWRATGDALSALGTIAQTRSEHLEARQFFDEALQAYRTVNHLSGIANTLHNLGNVAYDLGENTLARQLYQQSMDISRQIGGQWGMAGSISGERPENHENAVTPASQQDFHAYESELRRSLNSALKLGQVSLILRMLFNLAHIRSVRGKQDAALEILTILLHHPEIETSGIEDEAERLAYELQDGFDSQESNRIWERGKHTDFDQFIRQLLTSS